MGQDYERIKPGTKVFLKPDFNSCPPAGVNSAKDLYGSEATVLGEEVNSSDPLSSKVIVEYDDVYPEAERIKKTLKRSEISLTPL